MPAVQQLLFPDPRPLVERLGRNFFLALPTSPGVYLMRNAAGAAIYIGKAKNLRRRLRAYRVANPGRLKRRHLRLLGAAVAIDIELCLDEAAALAREAELILLHKPRFNRAGTWPTTPRYVGWRAEEKQIEIFVTERLEEGWTGIGPLGSGSAMRYRAALVRLLWFLLNTGRPLDEMPFGWIHGRLAKQLRFELAEDQEQIIAILQALTEGSSEPLSTGVRLAIRESGPRFLADLVEEDLERIGRFEIRSKAGLGELPRSD